jgi:enamine deaminase RidA (YjgF/YER057c/UK114 family)
MAVKRWNPEGVARPAAYYSHLAAAPAGAAVVAMAGQVGTREDGSIPDSVEEQLEIALDKVVALASSAGKGEQDILKVVAFLTEEASDNARVGAALRKAFPSAPPALTWIYVKALFRPGLKVEIDVTLAVGP